MDTARERFLSRAAGLPAGCGGFAAFLIPALLLCLAGCSPGSYRRRADREVYGIIEAGGREVPGMHEGFSVERAGDDLLERLPVVPAGGHAGADAAEQLRLLDLENALAIAAAGSREYQRRKESVFLRALVLSNERSRHQPQFFWALRGDASYDSDDRWSAGARSSAGAAWLLAAGARLSAELSTTATRFLSGDANAAARSVFDLTLTQPLLRGSRIAAAEPLTQAQRDMIYELRDFVRFQRRFLVNVLADYYRVLEQGQRVENQRMNYENLARIRRRAEALGEAGRLPELQVDRARQNELGARDALEGAEQQYLRILDNFKITLGLKPETGILPDPGELDALHELDMTAPPIGRSESIAAALANRLDLATAGERVEDAARKVSVAANALKPGLDLVLGASARTARNRPLDFAGGTSSGSVGLDADLPLERTAERNTYRRRLIEYDQACRDYREQRDRAVLEVMNRWRDFDRAVGSYEIQKMSVRLAGERVESTEMLFDAGRATTRDLLDAHEDLLRAQNGLAQTLVDFRIAALELERDMDILVVDEKGRLLEGAGYHGNTETVR